MKKTAREIRMLREASRVTDEAVRAVLEEDIRPGVTEVGVS
jgi:Xaa-Pro aminopeptidase